MATSKAVIAANPKHYLWWFPGSPVKVHLDLQVVQRLNERLRTVGKSPEEGLLFGNTRDGATEIHDFEPAASRSVPTILASLPNRLSRSVVGYYRTEGAESFQLTAADRTLGQECFGKPHQVFLMIQSNSFGSPSATFFFYDRDRQMSDFTLLEFPFDSSLLAVEEHDRLERSQRAALVRRDPEAPAPTGVAPASPAAPSKIRSYNLDLLLTRAKWAAALILAFVLGMVYNSRPFRDRVSRVWHAITSPSETATPSVSAAAIPSSYHPSMALRAARQGGDLALTWNRESPLIVAATSGAISIQDGESRRLILLDPAQLRSGSLLYSPQTDQIVMQFSVTTPVETASESVMVVVPKNGGPQTYLVRIPKATAETVAPTATQPDSEPAVRPTKPFVAPASKKNSAQSSPLPADLPVVNLGVHTPLQAAIPGIALQAPPPPQPALRPTQETAARDTSPAPSSQSQSISAYQPPVAISKRVPPFPVELQNLTLHRTVVEVEITIDKTGRVSRAQPVYQKGISQFLLNAATNAASMWKFQPAKQNNEAISSQMVLQFVFSR